MADDSKDYVLKNIDVRVERGQFVIVMGKVGSGKSSLLGAMNNLMFESEGSSISINGTRSMVTQESFLLNDTLKNNILFGNAFD